MPPLGDDLLDEPCRPCWLPSRHTVAEHDALEADVTAADLAAYGFIPLDATLTG